MTESTTHTRRSLTESPWYWVYLFCTAGLIALMLAGPKFAARQLQIERKAQGRQRAAQNIAGQEPVTPLSEEGRTHIQLRPLYYVLGGILALAWGGLLWKQYFGRRTRETVAGPDKITTPSDSTTHKPAAT